VPGIASRGGPGHHQLHGPAFAGVGAQRNISAPDWRRRTRRQFNSKPAPRACEQRHRRRPRRTRRLRAGSSMSSPGTRPVASPPVRSRPGAARSITPSRPAPTAGPPAPTTAARCPAAAATTPRPTAAGNAANQNRDTSTGGTHRPHLSGRARTGRNRHRGPGTGTRLAATRAGHATVLSPTSPAAPNAVQRRPERGNG
jgi:hypothetical protein